MIVIGSPDSIHTFAHELEPGTDGTPNVLVVGGGDIGYHVARLLQERGLKPRLVEQDQGRARELAESLNGTTVLESDATDRAFLEREHVDDVDIVIAALNNDEKTCSPASSPSVSVPNEPSQSSIREATSTCSRKSASTWQSIHAKRPPKR